MPQRGSDEKAKCCPRNLQIQSGLTDLQGGLRWEIKQDIKSRAHYKGCPRAQEMSMTLYLHVAQVEN